jgi:hypothetical protein
VLEIAEREANRTSVGVLVYFSGCPGGRCAVPVRRSASAWKSRDMVPAKVAWACPSVIVPAQCRD